MEKLNENQPILISEVEQFGWYSYDIHEQKKSLYEKIEPQRFEANLRRNQNLQFKSFQVTRNQKILQRQINFLTGAFGLCYYKFREEYEVFFSKIDIHNDKWVISKNKNIIFLQLFALTPYDDIEKIKKLTENDNNLIDIYYLMRFTLNYLTKNTFTNEEYFDFLKNEFSQYKDTEELRNDLTEVYERYIRQGINFNISTPTAKAVCDFLMLTQNDIDSLFNVIGEREFTKTAIFLIGMYHSAATLDKVFKFNSIVPSFVILLTSFIEDITVNEEDVEIHFRKDAIETNASAFSMLKRYIKTLKNCQDLKESITILERYTEINLIREQIELMDKEIILLFEEKNKDKTILNLNVIVQDSENKLNNEIKKNELLSRSFTALQGSKSDIENEMNLKNNEILKLSNELDQKNNTIIDNNLEIDNINNTISTLKVQNDYCNKIIGNQTFDLSENQNKIQQLEFTKGILTNEKNNLQLVVEKYLKLAEDYLSKYLTAKHIFLKFFNKKKLNISINQQVADLRKIKNL